MSTMTKQLNEVETNILFFSYEYVVLLKAMHIKHNNTNDVNNSPHNRFWYLKHWIFQVF